MRFELHKQLQEDSLILGCFELCLLLRIKDEQYPWYVLVPQRENIREIYELSDEDRLLFYKESQQVSEAIMEFYKADKLNVASIGNMVPQLHVHHIARFKTDISWPSPVWGKYPMKLGNEIELTEEARHFVAELGNFKKQI